MKFQVEKANIVKVTTDAIVLPANETLVCTSEKGAYGAIFKAAGKEKLERACREVLREQGKESCAIGSAVVTPAFGLKAGYIIHAVVPRWEGGEHEEYSKLCSAYLSALALADHLTCDSIAFPLLASGQKKFSKKLAIQAAAECFKVFQGENLKKIILVVYDDNSVLCAKELGYTVHETYRSPHKKTSQPNVIKQIIDVGAQVAGGVIDVGGQIAGGVIDVGGQIAGGAIDVGGQIAGGAMEAMKWLAAPENQKMIKDSAEFVMWALVVAGGVVAGGNNSDNDSK